MSPFLRPRPEPSALVFACAAAAFALALGLALAGCEPARPSSPSAVAPAGFPPSPEAKAPAAHADTRNRAAGRPRGRA